MCVCTRQVAVTIANNVIMKYSWDTFALVSNTAMNVADKSCFYMAELVNLSVSLEKHF